MSAPLNPEEFQNSLGRESDGSWSSPHLCGERAREILLLVLGRWGIIHGVGEVGEERNGLMKGVRWN